MKKIMFFICTLDDGGAQRVVSVLASELVNKYDVEILKYYEGNNIYPLNERVKVSSVEQNTKSKNKLKNIIWMKKYFNNNADIVISFLAPYNILALLSKGKTPMIVADRNDPKRVPNNKYVRKIRDFLYRKANAVVVQTEANKQYFSNEIQEKTSVISNPVDLKEKTAIGLITKKQNKIVSVGRITPQKNQLLLIESFSEVLKVYDNYELYFYGDVDNVNYKNELDKKIDENNMTSKVHFMGSVKNILDEIADAKLFVLSSNYEGMPNALIEAMCLGLPVISTNVSGSRELIQDGENGYVVDINNKEQLTEKMLLVLENDTIRKKISNNAYLISDDLKLNKIVEKWKKLIDNFI